MTLARPEELSQRRTHANTASAGTYGPCRVIKGEFQGGPINVHPPCELDVMMYNGTLGGQDYWVRCNHLGGQTLGYEYWQGTLQPVCYAVDY